MYGCLDKSKPCPFPISPTQTYLGENELGYYVMDGFFDNIGNMFKRMVKFTPKSFTPGNLYEGLINTTLTVASGGIYQVLPKDIKKTVYDIGKVAVPVVAGAAAAAAFGPAIMSTLTPKLQAAANVIGKNLSSVGKGLFDAMGKLTQSQQAQVAQQVTPQEIVAIEQTGQIPPHVAAMISQMEQQAYGTAAAENILLRQENEKLRVLQNAANMTSFQPMPEPPMPLKQDGGEFAPYAALGLGLLLILARR